MTGRAALALDEAVATARTGDLWLFRGRRPADRAIQLATRSPVNHVAMTVVLDDGRPLLWHADASGPLPDAWTGDLHPGAQLHDLRSAVVVWARRFRQAPWLRRVHAPLDPAAADAVRETIAAHDGTPYPAPLAMAAGWLRARLPARRTPDQDGTIQCAGVVALAYEAMGLLRSLRRASWYDPGTFWDAQRLDLADGVRLGHAVPVHVPGREPR